MAILYLIHAHKASNKALQHHCNGQKKDTRKPNQLTPKIEREWKIRPTPAHLKNFCGVMVAWLCEAWGLRYRENAFLHSVFVHGGTASGLRRNYCIAPGDALRPPHAWQALAGFGRWQFFGNYCIRKIDIRPIPIATPKRTI